MSSASIIFLGAVAGGFVTGLAGFGTGLAALSIWLIVLPPTTASTLVLVCSVAAQCLTLAAIWRTVAFSRFMPLL